MVNTYMGQKVLFLTELFGKHYFWMQDGDETVYLVKAKEQKSLSVGPNGTEEVFEGWLPDFS